MTQKKNTKDATRKTEAQRRAELAAFKRMRSRAAWVKKAQSRPWEFGLATDQNGKLIPKPKPAKRKGLNPWLGVAIYLLGMAAIGAAVVYLFK